MLKLAGVTKKDVVYDLGCGDGRIVITAVDRFKAKRSVGVDLDPERLKECQANAQEKKVTDRLEFRKGDVLDIKDLSEATVVTLYMSDAMNLRLRPILQKTLRPRGTHRFASLHHGQLETPENGDGTLRPTAFPARLTYGRSLKRVKPRNLPCDRV